MNGRTRPATRYDKQQMSFQGGTVAQHRRTIRPEQNNNARRPSLPKLTAWALLCSALDHLAPPLLRSRAQAAAHLRRLLVQVLGPRRLSGNWRLSLLLLSGLARRLRRVTRCAWNRLIPLMTSRSLWRSPGRHRRCCGTWRMLRRRRSITGSPESCEKKARAAAMEVR